MLTQGAKKILNPQIVTVERRVARLDARPYFRRSIPRRESKPSSKLNMRLTPAFRITRHMQRIPSREAAHRVQECSGGAYLCHAKGQNIVGYPVQLSKAASMASGRCMAVQRWSIS